MKHDANFRILQASVRAILLHARAFEWSLQGFGMLRTFLGSHNLARLHIWDSRYTTPNFSPIHDHPWHFQSNVIAGRIRNIRYREVVGVPAYARMTAGEEYLHTKIRCGAGGGMVNDEAKPIWLRRGDEEVYLPGERYSQEASELHESFPDDGTVTIIYRDFTKDTEHARVCWKSGPWVSAEPRPATPDEVEDIVGNALSTWK